MDWEFGVDLNGGEYGGVIRVSVEDDGSYRAPMPSDGADVNVSIEKGRDAYGGDHLLIEVNGVKVRVCMDREKLYNMDEVD